MVYKFEEHVRSYAEKALKELGEEVHLMLFTHASSCLYCREMEEFIAELQGFSPKIKVTKGLTPESKEAKRHRIAYIPALLIHGYKIVYYGTPSGQEVVPFIDTLVEASLRTPKLKEESKRRISKITSPFHLRIFTTPTCPYCPGIVSTANRFALLNENFRVDVVDTLEFPKLVVKYQVTSVPKVVINDRLNIEGKVSEAEFVEKIAEARYIFH